MTALTPYDWSRMYQEPNVEKWHRRFLSLCLEVAKWSKDPSTKTGCLIVDDRRRILSTGYNGFARGVEDTPERYENRELKYAFVVHADLNAIYSAAANGVSVDGCTMYLTGPPCAECCKGIIQAGIKQVIWPEDNPFEKDEATRARWAVSLDNSNTLLREGGVRSWRMPSE